MASTAQHHGAVGTLDAAYVMFAVGIAPTPEIAAAVGRAVDLVKAGARPWGSSARTYFNFAERPIGGARLYPLKTYTYQRLRGDQSNARSQRDVRLQPPDPAGRRSRYLADFERTSVRRPPPLRSSARRSRRLMGRGRGRRRNRSCHRRRIGKHRLSDRRRRSRGHRCRRPDTAWCSARSDTFGEIRAPPDSGTTRSRHGRRPGAPGGSSLLSGPDFERIRGPRSRSSSSTLRRLGLERTSR